MLDLAPDEEVAHHIRQQDNQLFRLVRLVTKTRSTYNPFVIFVDCSGISDASEAIKHLVYEGVVLHGRRFVMSERSASMTRVGVVSMIDERIADEIDERVSMGLGIKETVLSKYYAYRGLMFSSCHCLEGWKPKIIVVSDLTLTIKDQRIRYIYDAETRFIDKDGNERDWKQKDVAEKTMDVDISAFDGCGIIHPALVREVEELVGSETRMSSMIVRAPFIKGLLNEIDYYSYFSEHGVDFVQDIWGRWHSAQDIMIIMTESMYKGFSYFRKDGTSADWDRYWDAFEKYGHCIGIAKWNFTADEEPLFTRGNYQILQDLDIEYDIFRGLADDSIEWADSVIDGDELHTLCFLGLTADKCTPVSPYAKAVLKNPAMLKEQSVRAYMISMMKKYLDEMKCGKLWLKACFKFLLPDQILLLQHIGGMELVGSLAADEFYTSDVDGAFSGEFLIERNPHICKSEHVLLNAVSTDEILKYCGHLDNICMVNCHSLSAPRLNGADFDGDLVLVVDNDIMRNAVQRDIPIVMDIDDKISAIAEPDTVDNRYKMVMRTLKSMIGEYSNYASAYHNKCPRTQEQKEKYEKYIDIISVITGKSIDYAKTGVLFHMPRHIAKWGRPLPHFMKYRDPYYARQKLSMSPSNMNRLCWELERWDRGIRWKRRFPEFDYSIMIDEAAEYSDEVAEAVEAVYLEFGRETRKAYLEQARIRKYVDKDVRQRFTRGEARNYKANWKKHYDGYRAKFRKACPDEKVLANILVRLGYEKYPKRDKRIMWNMAGDGIVKNIKQVERLMLPKRDPEGSHRYLGRRYSTAEVQANDLVVGGFEEID